MACTPTFSYRLGVADGLAAMANWEKKRELEQVQRKELDRIAAKEREESKKRQREVDRLHLVRASLSHLFCVQQIAAHAVGNRTYLNHLIALHVPVL